MPNAQTMPPNTEARLAALLNAKPNSWVALSADETRVVGAGATFAEAALAAEASGEVDPVMIFVPENWTPRVL